MTQKTPSVNFYDSDCDSRNESYESDDSIDLNVAFLASPERSISYLFDESSLKDPVGMFIYNNEKDRDKKINKLIGKRATRVEQSCQGNPLKTTEEAFKTGLSLEEDLEPYSLANPGYLSNIERNWVSTAKRNCMPRLGDFVSELGSIEVSEAIDLSIKKEDTAEYIFSSTCLDEFRKTSDEYDWRKIEKRSFFEMDDESDKISKIRAPVSQSDYVYHELSTIPEVDSVFIDDLNESLMVMNSDECDSSYMRDRKNSKILKANDLFDLSMKANSPSNSPAYVLKLIQNKHIEKFLQEPGILEESDLTLITIDLDSLSKTSEKSTKKGNCHNYYNIRRFDDDASASLISFEQHELNCMRDSFEE